MNKQSPNMPVAALEPSVSTGPRTEAGKAISSQNARKHDLCSRILRLSPEESEEYHDLCARYSRDLQPADHVEQTLVDEICFNYWRLQQAREVELRIIDEHPTDLPIISLYIRYRTSYERGYYKALDKLQQTQRIRQQQAVRSAKLQSAPVQPARSEQDIAETALHLEDQMEGHLLENKVRAKLALPPLEMPEKLAARVEHFVSQNPGALPQSLVDKFKKAA